MKRRQAITTIASMAALGVAPYVRAQSGAYPNKPIKFIVPFTAGSGADSGSRVYGEMLSKV